MAADMIENYEHHLALTFIESCPTNWEKTLVPVAEIGKHVTIARKERGGAAIRLKKINKFYKYPENPTR